MPIYDAELRITLLLLLQMIEQCEEPSPKKEKNMVT